MSRRIGSLVLAAAAGLACGLAPSASVAQQIMAPQLACADLAARVQRGGRVLIHSAPGIYDNYVSGPQFCGLNARVGPGYVPARDNRSCQVGYVCLLGGGSQR
jgi:hypothetical protein